MSRARRDRLNFGFIIGQVVYINDACVGFVTYFRRSSFWPSNPLRTKSLADPQRSDVSTQTCLVSARERTPKPAHSWGSHFLWSPLPASESLDSMVRGNLVSPTLANLCVLRKHRPAVHGFQHFIDNGRPPVHA